MGERGIDISEWQAGMDVERVVRENNISFVMVRTNYGSEHDDALFHRHCDGAERGGAIVTPYSYPLATDTRGSIDDAVRIIGGRYDRCIVDWEVGSGGGDHLRIAHEHLWERDLRTPVAYDPAWYYQQVGSPNIDWMGRSGRISGRWKSWYPDNIPGSFDAVLKKLAASVWGDSRGGISTLIVQFSSSVLLNGWDKVVDANWFRGTHDELVALLTGDNDMANLNEQRVPVSGAPEGTYDEMADIALGAAVGNARTAVGILRELLERPEAAPDAIAAQVRAGLVEDLAPLFDLARRLES